MSGLVEEIQARAIDPTVKVGDLLRMVKLAAAKLKLEDTVAWADLELRGYRCPDNEVPAYRKLNGRLMETVPMLGTRQAFGDAMVIAALSQVILREPISSLESLAAKESTVQMPLDAKMAQFVNEQRDADFTYHISFGTSVLVGIVSNVKDIVLNWACELEQQGILGEGISFSMEEKAKAEKVASAITINYGPVHNGDVNGNQNRTSVNSTDNSTNTITTENVFQQLTQAIESSIGNHNDRDTILGIVKEMEKTKGTAGYTAWFQQFMGHAANYVTVLTPFLPALTQLLP